MNEHKIGLQQVPDICQAVLAEVEKAIIGKRHVLEQVLAALLSQGHVLLEDNPGVAKTQIAKSFSRVLGLDFKRIQFTPDLLPGDILGGFIFDRQNNQFQLKKGPIFTSLLLADEINRASPKAQSALLEAMEEKQVTLDGETLMLPQPFFVMATQNPIEYESTFPLPEAQLDRFLLKLSVGYPSQEQEIAILAARQHRHTAQASLEVITERSELVAMQNAVEQVTVSDALQSYIVQIVRATRNLPNVVVGASPRASLALLSISRAWAAMQGRDYVLPDDIKAIAIPCLAHRLSLSPELWGQDQAAEKIIQGILNKLAVPMEQGNGAN
ncbi:AAA family ATPase [Motilimonas cestriensis]|uniref:AAA family ATPase n=1 Tax=Motilimonas cestriensis TaxID=2742685 RepID=UPI003DA23930